MIKGLRRKFTIVAMCSTFAVLAIIMGIFHIVSYLRITKNADHLTEMIADNGGEFPEPFLGEDRAGKPQPRPKPAPKDSKQEDIKPENKKDDPNRMSPETPYETRYFSVSFDANGSVSSSELGNVAAISDVTAVNYANEIKESGRQKGFKGTYRYRLEETDTGSLAVFVDCHNELESFWSNALIMLCVSATGLLAVFVLVTAFSDMVFRPVAKSDQKQKRFITDVSHEIKTPLTIIDANAEVIEMENGESAWTKSIRNQVRRLTALTQQMVTLSRLDEENGGVQKEYFSLSDVVEESMQPFEALAKKDGKRISSKLEKGIYIFGAEKSISQLVGLLLDNAVKYSSPDSVIELSLMRKGKKAYLKVYNPVEKLPKGNLDILFERFYTMDDSRNSKSSGSGIGLSIARAIVVSHRGKITARSMDGKSIEVAVELSQTRQG